MAATFDLAVLFKVVSTAEKTLDFSIGASVDLLCQENSTLTTASVGNVYALSGALTSAASSVLSLWGGALENCYGEAMQLSTVNALIIRNRSSAAVLEVGGAAAQAWETWTNDAGSTMLLSALDAVAFYSPAGYQLTSLTDQLRLCNLTADAGASYQLMVVGLKNA